MPIDGLLASRPLHPKYRHGGLPDGHFLSSWPGPRLHPPERRPLVSTETGARAWDNPSEVNQLQPNPHETNRKRPSSLSCNVRAVAIFSEAGCRRGLAPPRDLKARQLVIARA